MQVEFLSFLVYLDLYACSISIKQSATRHFKNMNVLQMIYQFFLFMNKQVQVQALTWWINSFITKILFKLFTLGQQLILFGRRSVGKRAVSVSVFLKSLHEISLGKTIFLSRFSLVSKLFTHEISLVSKLLTRLISWVTRDQSRV